MVPWNRMVEVVEKFRNETQGLLMQRSDELPRQTLEPYKTIAAFGFGRLASRAFAHVLTCLGEKNHESSYLITLEPDPVDYYHSEFGLAPFLELGISLTEREFLDRLHWSPEPGGADSIATHAMTIAICCHNGSWLILAERRFELARMFVREDCLSLQLECCIPNEWRYSSEEFASVLIEADVDPIISGLLAKQLSQSE